MKEEVHISYWSGPSIINGVPDNICGTLHLFPSKVVCPAVSLPWHWVPHHMVHALRLSRIDYLNALYMGLPMRLVWKLQQVQNMVARLPSVAKIYLHISLILDALHWLPIHFRPSFKLMVLIYRVLNGLGPRHLAEHLFPNGNAHPTESSRKRWQRIRRRAQ